MAGDVRTSHQKSPAFVSTKTAGDVLTSSQKYQTFVTLKMSGNILTSRWKYNFLMPQEWLEMSRLPVPQSTSGNVLTSHHNICNKSPKHVWQTFQRVVKNTQFCHPNMVGDVPTSCKMIHLLSPQTSSQALLINIRSCCPKMAWVSTDFPSKIYLFPVATNVSGKSPKVLLKTPGFVAPTRLQKSQLPVRNIQLLSRLNWLEISHHPVSFKHILCFITFSRCYITLRGVVSLQASSV